MWKLSNIQATDFMSFDNVSFDFDSKCYVVRADNQDNEGQQSNGGGKTSFVDLIAVALLGKSLTGRNVKDCVRWGADQSYFTLRCTLIDDSNVECVIDRKVYNNTRSQELSLLVDGKVPSTLPTKRGVENGVDIKQGNAYILNEVLHITESDLLSYYLISKDKYQPFLNINTDSKLAVIGRFSKSGIVDRAIMSCEADAETVRSNVGKFDRQITTEQGYIQALQESDDAQQFESNKQQQLDSLDQQLSAIEITLVNKDTEIEGEEEQMKDYGLCFHEINPQDKIDLQTILDSLDEKEMVGLISQLRLQIGTIEGYLAGVITCPDCGHDFNLQSDLHFTEQDLLDKQAALTDCQDQLDSMRKSKWELREDISTIESLEHENRDVELEINRCIRKIESIKQEQARLVEEYDRLEFTKANVAAKTFADQQFSTQQRIDDKLRLIESIQSQLDQATVDLDHFNTWIAHLEDFKFFLGNKPIEAICSLVNQYLQLNGSDLNLHIEGFKKLRSGELRQSLQPVIYRNWQNPQSFDQFSQGEKVRLNLTVDLAFQHLLNQSNDVGGLDLYVNDELLNPLDSVGVSNAAAAFDQLGKTMLLVTHSGADMVYDNTILITKKDGTSKMAKG
jgi:hypothetical protein